MPHELLDERLIGSYMRDLGALMHAATVLVGDRLGLYKAMADCRWLSPGELAARTETDTRHIRETLAEDGTCLLVEPYAADRLEDNLTPVGRIFYAASTMVCTPCSRSQDVGLALGGQAGEARLREVLEAAGFTRVRRATQTPFNLVIEARR